MSDDTFRAIVDMVVYGYVEEGDEVVHEIILYEGETYDVDLESSDEEDVLLLKITDEADQKIFESKEASASEETTLEPKVDNVFRFYVRSEKGDHEYSITIEEEVEE